MIKVKSTKRRIKTDVSGTETYLTMEIAYVAAGCIRDFTDNAVDFERVKANVIALLSNIRFSNDNDLKMYMSEDNESVESVFDNEE